LSVSVIIAAFNAEACIARAIASLREQTTPPFEVIVADDASTDGTRDVVRRLQRVWPAIRMIELEENGGPSRARNCAIDAAVGDWVAILDADDFFKPHRLQVLEKLGEETGADIIADNLILFDDAAGVEGRHGFYVDWTTRNVSLFEFLANTVPEAADFNYGILKPMIRRRFLDETRLRYDEQIRYGEDVLFYAETLFNKASMWLSSQAMYVYSTRVGEISKTNNIHSKSAPRFDLLAEANESLLDRYADRSDASIREVMRRRTAGLRAIHLANVARAYRKSGNLARYVLTVLLHPGLLQLLLLRTWKRTLALARRGLPRSVARA
jgi:succinoglycan biosynthesis protein ExoO